MEASYIVNESFKDKAERETFLNNLYKGLEERLLDLDYERPYTVEIDKTVEMDAYCDGGFPVKVSFNDGTELVFIKHWVEVGETYMTRFGEHISATSGQLLGYTALRRCQSELKGDIRILLVKMAENCFRFQNMRLPGPEWTGKWEGTPLYELLHKLSREAIERSRSEKRNKGLQAVYEFKQEWS